MPEDFSGAWGFVRLLESGDDGLGLGEGFLNSDSVENPAMGLREMAQKSGCGGSESPSTSSSSGRSFPKAKNGGERKAEPKRRIGLPSASVVISGADCRKPCKKPKSEAPLKVSKEKLGERITALQQLVSPYGKTDTASVLHEAMGYIRFLHEQVQVLSSPYLQRPPSSASTQGGGGEEPKYDLLSRGLCLVPVASTLHVTGSNGADFWSPAMGNR